MEKIDICILAVLSVAVIITAGCIGLAVSHSDSSDDAPSWAKESASQLEKYGGGVNVYRTWGDSNYGYSTNISVTKDSKVVADSTGITVIYDNGEVTHFPYDRIARIYINNTTGGI